MKKIDESLVNRALKAIAEEEHSIFIDSKNISDEDLKNALLTVADIKVLCDDYNQSEELVVQELKEKD